MARIYGLLLAALVCMTGCLGTTFTIPHDELARLASTPPELRGEAVRVTQDFSFRRHNPSLYDPMTGRLLQQSSWQGGTSAAHDTLWVSGLLAGGWAKGLGNANLGNAGQGAILIVAVIAAMEAAAATLLVGTGLASVLAVGLSEAARFDGWAAMPLNQPLDLRIHDRAVSSTATLGSLTESDVQPGMTARLEGALHWIRRAPLNRRGLYGTHALLLGWDPASAMPATGGALGSIGWSPNNWVSLGVASQLTFMPIAGGSTWRFDIGPEITLWALRWVGVYQSVGVAVLRAGADPTTRTTVETFVDRAGLVAEIPLRTRVAMQFRAGFSMTPFLAGSIPVEPETSIGFALY